MADTSKKDQEDGKISEDILKCFKTLRNVEKGPSIFNSKALSLSSYQPSTMSSPTLDVRFEDAMVPLGAYRPTSPSRSSPSLSSSDLSDHGPSFFSRSCLGTINQQLRNIVLNEPFVCPSLNRKLYSERWDICSDCTRRGGSGLGYGVALVFGSISSSNFTFSSSSGSGSGLALLTYLVSPATISVGSNRRI